MTVLFSTDCESYAAAATLPGWALAAGAGMTVRNGATVSYPVAGGLMGYGGNSADDSSVYTSSGLIGEQALRTDAKGLAIASGLPNFVGHLLRSSANGAQSYRVALEANGSAVRVALYRYQSGSTLIGSSAYAFTPATSDIAHLESRAVGSTIEVRLWLNAEARPSTPTLTVTDATFATGYPGLRCLPGGGWRLTDNIVVTDAAGGEDFFDTPAAGTHTLTGAATTQSATSSSGAITVDEPPAGTVNLSVASTSQGATSGTGAVTSVAPSGTITPAEQFGNNTRSLFTNQAVTVFVSQVADNAPVATKNLTTTADAYLLGFSDPSFVVGTSYRCVFMFASGDEGLETLAAA